MSFNQAPLVCDIDCRFLLAGKHYELLTEGNVAEHAVLDMRSNDTQPSLQHHTNLHHVLFATDFKSAKLRLGNEVLATLCPDT